MGIDMEIFKAVVYLLLGFVLLIKGADCFVDGKFLSSKEITCSINSNWVDYRCYGYKSAQNVRLV